MKVSVFIRSYPTDNDWLLYCLRALRKFLRDHHEIVVCTLEEFRGKTACRLGEVDFSGCRQVFDQKFHQNDYIGQQISKIGADLHCTGDAILHVDCDCITQREFSVNEMFAPNGKPMLLWREWNEVGGAACWRAPTERVLGEAPIETMATHPSIYLRSTMEKLRAFIEARHDRPWAEYLGSLDRLSEFNLIGNFIGLHDRESYEFIKCVGPGVDPYPRPLKQHWSHDRVLGPQEREFEGLLK